MEPEPGRLGVGEFAFPGPLRDQLVAAIIAGTKTTTTGLLADYELDAEPLPRPGDRQVVIDSAGIPVALIETIDARVVRVGDIDLAHAIGEGEGYASVAEWRSGHDRFWHSPEYRQYRGDPAFTVTDDTLAVAEQFHVVADDHQDLGSLLQRARESDADRAQLSPSPADHPTTRSPPLPATRHARSQSAAGVLTAMSARHATAGARRKGWTAAECTAVQRVKRPTASDANRQRAQHAVPQASRARHGSARFSIDRITETRMFRFGCVIGPSLERSADRRGYRLRSRTGFLRLRPPIKG